MSKKLMANVKCNYTKFPLHYKGAPQRRLYFPNWVVVLSEPKDKNAPQNYARFHVPPDMTQYDVKEYLSTIYGLKILNVKLSVVNYVRYRSQLPWKPGSFEWKFLYPWKIAHVFLANEEKFQFPDILKNADPERNELTELELFEQQQNELRENELKLKKDEVTKTHLDNSWFS